MLTILSFILPRPQKRTYLLSGLLTLFACTTSLAQITRYVSTTGNTPAASATGWTASTSNLQGAIDYVAANGGGQVWVAAGTYKPTTTTGPDSRTISFAMKNGVTIYGGFAATGTPAFNERNPASFTTILSGDIGTAGYNGDNSYHVIFNNNNGLTSSARLDGFVIIDGNASGPTENDANGGGMYNISSSPLLVNCMFINNRTTNTLTNGGGGGMCNKEGSNAALFNCSFINNQGGDDASGAAIANIGSNPQLTNCRFERNVVSGTAGFGGAIYNSNVSSPAFTNCGFIDNVSSAGGAINNYTDCSPVLLNCSFQNNTDSYGGGVIFNSRRCYPVLTNCVLFGNGGARTFSNSAASSVTARHCLIESTVTSYTGTNNLTTSSSPFESATSVALAACSPAINAGDPTTTTATAGSTDLTGNPRIVEGRVDIGAFESQALPVGLAPLPASATAVCSGERVSLPASVTGTVIAYQWYKNGSPVISQTTAALSIPQAGTADAGSYSLVVTGTCNSVTSTAFSLTVNALPSVTVTAPPSATLSCINPGLTLTATASTTALLWSTGQTTTTISVSQTGGYSVTATGANGCSAVSNNLPVTENFSLPPFSVSSATVCPGQSANLTASGCGGQILWSTGATTAMITLTAGSSTSLLTATCTAGVCSATTNGQVVVGGIQPPPAQILSFTADESACPVRLTGRGAATSFTMTGPKGYVFSTVYREGTTHEAIGLNVKLAGTYTLTATYTNNCGTSEPVTRTVTINRNCP